MLDHDDHLDLTTPAGPAEDPGVCESALSYCPSPHEGPVERSLIEAFAADHPGLIEPDAYALHAVVDTPSSRLRIFAHAWSNRRLILDGNADQFVQDPTSGRYLPADLADVFDLPMPHAQPEVENGGLKA